ncbi:coniferyl-alcohol dehydrogenase [Curtobacterium sp. VKM Ac-2887]|uniref:coniferyl-alcohol dehydrogenase n=1 Tax=Curtobacterium sp. VKM Ac-2887 TaxID=2783819 RepID=UPI00188B5A07|nr:coniferyl-alcohol dehydrogenase [Curtobacterium sp. VKM Ac-2887]MBF4585703.1 coniferyl-alcohol dehydrogenase [Curtobacterium sp. VKM Ac-2887]
MTGSDVAVDFTDYFGKRVVVTGCSSGIGRAVARTLLDLGADVIGVDRNEPDPSLRHFVEVDLGDPDSIRRGTEVVGGSVDALFNCAALPPMAPPMDLLRVNFLGTRLLTERIAAGMSDGAAIVSTSSDGGFRWRKRLPLLLEFLGAESFDAALAWYESNADRAGHPYAFGKEALNVWTMTTSSALITRGIRINTVSPGSVQTPMLEAIENVFPAEMLDATTHVIGRRSTADEQVAPMLFLNSPMASYVNGADLVVDGGHWAQLSAAGDLWD